MPSRINQYAKYEAAPAGRGHWTGVRSFVSAINMYIKFIALAICWYSAITHTSRPYLWSTPPPPQQTLRVPLNAHGNADGIGTNGLTFWGMSWLRLELGSSSVQYTAIPRTTTIVYKNYIVGYVPVQSFNGNQVRWDHSTMLVKNGVSGSTAPGGLPCRCGK